MVKFRRRRLTKISRLLQENKMLMAICQWVTVENVVLQDKVETLTAQLELLEADNERLRGDHQWVKCRNN